MIYERNALEKELREWMRLSLEGDRPAYEKLLKKIAEMVRGYLNNALGKSQRTEEKVEDLVQEVLISIHRKKHLYQPTLPILPWLFTIARYRMIDHIRLEQRRPKLTEWEETFDPPAPDRTAPLEEIAFELEERLEPLSDRQKEILIMAKAEGIPLAEIAGKLGMSLASVKVTIHRALKKVRSSGR